MDYSELFVWHSVLHLGALSILLLSANILRRKVPFLRKSLLPTAVIAGFLGLILKETLFIRLVSETTYQASNDFLRILIYHSIALGFIALGLKLQQKIHDDDVKKRSIFSGLLIVSTYILQGMIGLSLTLFMAFTIFPNLFSAAGMLLPMGFGQGPGQASNIGTLYENTYGFVGGSTFGLAIASFGFIWASTVGVFYLNYLNKKQLLPKRLKEKRTLITQQEIDTPNEIPVAEAIDKFTIQIALVFLVYMFTFGFIFGSARLLDTGILGAFGIDTIKPLIIGFNFIFGMLFALVFKRIFIGLKKTGLMTRQYPNNFMLNRVAGFIFDFMIVAAITAIRIEDLRDLWVPFFILVFVVGTATLFYVKWIVQRIYPKYPIPATMGMFGMLSGTVSTGVVLIREVDPDFKTPAINDLVLGSSTAILFGFPILLLVGFAPISTMYSVMTLIIIIILFIISLAFILKFNAKPTGKKC